MIVIFLLHYSVTVASMLTVGRLEISYINTRFQQTDNVILGKLNFHLGKPHWSLLRHELIAAPKSLVELDEALWGQLIGRVDIV